jgi:hypothetical protein
VLEEFLRRVPLERRLADDEREERRAQRVDVGAAVHPRLVQPLLRRDEVGRADHRAVVELLRQPVLGLGGTGQAHVENLDRPAPVADEVAGLDVAVDEPLLVRVLQAGRGLRDVLRRRGVRDGPVAVENLLERLALDVLHHEVRRVVVPGDVEDADDVRVVQRRRGAGLALEPFEREFVILVLAGHENLDRHLAVQFQVFGEVHRPHPAAAEQILDDVRADPEPAVPAGEQLLGLEAGDHPLRDQGRGGLLGVARQGEVGDPGELIWSRNSTLAKEIDQLAGRSRGAGHGLSTHREDGRCESRGVNQRQA